MLWRMSEEDMPRWTYHMLSRICHAVGKPEGPCSRRRERFGKDPLLVDGGDPSHGMKKYGLAQRRRDENGILNLVHPPSPPDLNPSEGCWNIFKQRIRKVRGLRYLTDEQLQEKANEVWSGITLSEVRARIAEMPERCELLRETCGKRIK